MLPRSHAKPSSQDLPEALQAPLADMNRIAKFLHSRDRLNRDDATLEYLRIVRDSTRDMKRLIGKVQVILAGFRGEHPRPNDST